jgi:predicted acyltransferase
MRGLTLALMIVVNMSISDKLSYAPLLHATWHGLTLTDVVFPSFMFVVGAAMSFTLEKAQALGQAAFLVKVLKRSALIFLCGYLLYLFPFYDVDKAGHWAFKSLAEARIPGVLQRIGIAYGLACLILTYLGTRGAWVYSALALLGYWVLMASLGDYTLQGNAALKFDLWLLGPAHLYHGEGIAFDPEGVLGTLPAVVHVLAGYGAGRLVRRQGPSHQTVAQLMIAGALCIVLALSWSAFFPINKKLWTSSYVLCTVGIDLCVLAVLIDVLDLRRWTGWTCFFEVLGRNTLFIYLLSEVLNSLSWLVHVGNKAIFDWLYENFFQSWAGDKPGSLLFALAFLGLCWAVAWVMDKRRIYVRL